ncbi:MAG: BamA/TamA family outer membrane protein [Candidatus Saganbacteria bacterium]|nr:BamA/TamA family outer membrane protein [Candidatus Saganbacteria bacterium]
MKKIFCISAAVFLLSGISLAIDFSLKSAPDLGSLTGPAVTKTDAVTVDSLITGINIKGNFIIPSGKILEQVSIRVGDRMTQQSLNNDVKAIYAMGYFADVTTDLNKSRKGTAVTFNVVENPCLKGITIEGCSVYPAAKIFSMMRSKQGEIMSFKSIQEDIKAIDDMYHKDGYILERVVNVTTDPDTDILQIKLVEGAIEQIALDGNTLTKNYVILREMKSKPGTVLNEKVLAKDLKRIFNLGFFSDISPDFEPAAAPDKIILLVKVKESKTNTINFGGGYGEREGMFGFLDLSAENVFGTGQGILLRGQAGQQQSTYQFRYMYPWFLPDKLGDKVSATVRRWYTIGKNVYLIGQPESDGKFNGWDLSLNKPVNDEWNVTLTLGSERVEPTVTYFDPYTSNTIGFSLAYDTRDNWMNPSTGRFATFGITKGWKVKPDITTDFTKNTVDLNQFLKLADKQVLAFHFGVGVGVGDIPPGELYYVGGANTVRGYDPSQAQVGTKKYVANIEYRYTFNETFQGVLFYDLGKAWYHPRWPDLDNSISGRGFGLRLNTPMGPIRLDFGVGAYKMFSEGVLHFSIGQAF